MEYLEIDHEKYVYFINYTHDRHLRLFLGTIENRNNLKLKTVNLDVGAKKLGSVKAGRRGMSTF